MINKISIKLIIVIVQIMYMCYSLIIFNNLLLILKLNHAVPNYGGINETLTQLHLNNVFMKHLKYQGNKADCEILACYSGILLYAKIFTVCTLFISFYRLMFAF